MRSLVAMVVLVGSLLSALAASPAHADTSEAGALAMFQKFQPDAFSYPNYHGRVILKTSHFDYLWGGAWCSGIKEPPKADLALLADTANWGHKVTIDYEVHPTSNVRCLTGFTITY